MNLKRSILTTVLLGTIAVLSSTVTVRADSVHLFNTNSIDLNTTLAGIQFQVSTSSTGTLGEVRFTITNLGPVDSFIGQIYWDDNVAPLGVLSLLVDADAGFGIDLASPGNLPGGENVSFFADFSVDANPPPSINGLSPTDSGDFVFTLVAGMTIADVDAALWNGDLRVGIHVQGIDPSLVVWERDDSDSYVTTVPEPSTLILLLSSAGFLAGAAGFWRKLK